MRTLILAFGLVAIAVPASAQAPKRGNADLQTYCAGDAITFCAGIDPNSPQMDACFKKNMSQMSPNCRSAIDAYKSGGGK
ncbi:MULTISPECIES: 3',5'-cyclic-nucleotide phosphodiesterase [unclassified Methylobacterium]|uniref:3',5'-cyclic-nucleotide phosphodiesterase n=1 Tax=unclassified Methylobacterium TaxID=2615210 RepID=UPI0011C1F83D|nr:MULTISPECIES: 3',5'-cyclic-nucleotide phosphodiesterase [unclassified Methylobacterium]QEE37786.1 3',5'-cyclic-nucleotide phosphodiesterase [Methylobacterium sp. WL1]TXN05985.1 3',5'-cyclic-nucleotide phosphodiesterase [Methylobacterium sp. WL64]TXN56253.1 3',5'-cyclic-nucleotide phosphodiesterase [Methylobacterium sp. WL2]